MRVFAPIAIYAILSVSPVVTLGADFYASPSGRATGNGSIQSPWDLATALNNPPAVKPGDTIWLRGGRYIGTFTTRLNGTAAAPIIVRQYPGERAILEQNRTQNVTILYTRGSYTWYWGFEIMSSATTRQIAQSGSNPSTRPGNAIDNVCSYCKFINLTIHNNGQGIASWEDGRGTEIHGNVIFHNGWEGPDRGHGHGTYLQNQHDRQYVTDNIIWANFGNGMRAYTEGAHIDNLTFEGNIAFNQGTPSARNVYDRNLLVGSGSVLAHNLIVRDNRTYFTAPGHENNLGYRNGCANAQVTGNTFAGGIALNLVSCGLASMTGNTLYGVLYGFSASQHPSNTYYSNRPSGTWVTVRPNKYESGRGHVAVYNWNLSSTVAVNLSSILRSGDAYEIRDAQNFLGTPVLTGVYNGGSVNLPMNLTQVAIPIGNVPRIPPHTSAEFNAFVVLKVGTGSGSTPPPPSNSAPQVSAGADASITMPQSASLGGQVSDDGLPSNTLSIAWSKISGPGTVTFTSPGSPATSATFSAAGTYQLRLTASDGLLSAHDDMAVTVASPVDSTPPAISGLAASNVTGSGATITWMTNEAADSYVEWGPNGSSAYNSSYVMAHSMNIGGLQPGSSYQVRVRSRDQAGNATFSSVLFVNTPAAPPTSGGSVWQAYFELEEATLAAPIAAYSDAGASGGRYIATPLANSGSATLRFSVGQTGNYTIWLRTVSPSFAQDAVMVGMDGVEQEAQTAQGSWGRGWQWSAVNAGTPLTTRAFALTAGTHTLTLKGRNPWVAMDQVLITSDPSFVPQGKGTPSEPLPAATPRLPVISSVGASSSGTQAVVTWTTDVPSDSQVDFGTTTGLGQSSALDSNAVTAHSVTLTGLTAGATYYYRVKSQNADGQTVRGIYSFQLPAPPPASGGGGGEGGGEGEGGGTGTFVQYLEAEQGALTAPMATARDGAASGGQFVWSTVAENGKVTFTVTVPAAGQYTIWARLVAPNFRQDSFYVSVDNGQEDVFDCAEGRWGRTWQWSAVNGRNGTSVPNTLNPRTFSLAAGTHTISFRTRDAYTVLDRIMITNNPEARP